MKNNAQAKAVKGFAEYLIKGEHSANTIDKYTHDVEQFLLWLGGGELTKEAISAWKEHLCGLGRAAVTVNGALAALHSYCKFRGIENCRVKYLKRQRRIFRDSSEELTKPEYEKLVAAAEGAGNIRLALLFETICATGIRVSEVKYITVEALEKRQAHISLKGKIRTILIPGKLAKKLYKYIKKQKIASGEIFRTKSGKSLSRRQIWGEMKRICRAAGVSEDKVFPHNLRHLFARVFYRVSRDIVKLADVLGHSSIETTRIYLITTYEAHTRQMEKLGLVL